MGSPYGFGTTLHVPYEEAIPRVKEALRAEGFGVLTEIDVRQTLRDKLGAEMEPYLILGACNPVLAHRALAQEREIGLLLPCNVVVRTHDGQTVIEALDPMTMVSVTGEEALRPVAAEAATRLRAALATLAN